MLNSDIDSILYTPASRIRAFLRIARERGIDLDDFFAQVGQSEAQLLDPNLRVPRDQAVRFTKLFVKLIDDPELGLHLAERFELGDVDLFGYLVRHCRDTLEALEQLVRYSRLLGDSIECRMERRAGRVEIHIELAGGRRMSAVVVDYFVGALAFVTRALTQNKINPLQVHLARPRPARPERYENFFQAPVKYQTEECCLVYSERDALIPFANSDPRLREILEERADTLISELPPRTDLLDQIRSHISSRLELGEPTVREAARAFGMSERTIRRRLCDAGISFRQLLDEVRREKALRLADERVANVTDLALRSGFSNATAFARAFRRWTGMTPGQYLRRNPGKKAKPHSF
jgi:AraC-like DNA-binding protein